jgi:hypothetical protein
MSFETIYNHVVHHPGACWASVLAVCIWLWSTRQEHAWERFFWKFVLISIAVTFSDAAYTGAWSAIQNLAHEAASETVTQENILPFDLFAALSFLFVMLGDQRYLLLVMRFSKPFSDRSWGDPKVWLSSLALALIVPLALFGLKAAVPDYYGASADPRWTFLTYEVLFFALAAYFYAVWIPRNTAEVSAEVRVWLRRMTLFEMTHYALWVLADCLILSDISWGFGVRIIPNVIYYALFVPVLIALAPKGEIR